MCDDPLVGASNSPPPIGLAADAGGQSPLPSTGPLACWLALQLFAILIGVLRVPLAAQYPAPAEGMALYVLSGTQVVASGLLFPLLFRDVRCAGQIIVTTWPYLLAAGYLAGAAPKALAWPAAYVTGWLVTLALWAAVLRGARWRMIGVAVASLLTLGAAALRYLRLEFVGETAASQFAPETASPLLSTWTLLGGPEAPAGWILLVVLGLAAGMALALRSSSRVLNEQTERFAARDRT